MPPPGPKKYVFLRGFFDNNPARPFVALATQNKEVVRFAGVGGLDFYGSIRAETVDNPGAYIMDHAHLSDILAAVGAVVDATYALLPGDAGFALSYDDYVSLDIMGSAPGRSYQPYTPQFVDL